ncbi:RNA-directed DNA polymerase, eukaryota, reverse transcriptase zinc-binding domain protein, partial [Tanacetum coccineum]
LNRDVDDESLKNKGSSSNDADGFTEVVNRKNKGYGDKNSNNQTQNYGFYGQKKKPMAQFVYQKKNKAVLRKEKEDIQQNVRVPDRRTDQREPIDDSINSVNTSNGSNDKGTPEENSPEKVNDSGCSRKAWSVQCDIINAIRKSANKFSVLQDQDEHEKDMGDNNVAKCDVNDVLPDKNGIMKGMENDIIEGHDKGVFGNTNLFLMDFKIGCWNIRGLGTSDKQIKVKKFIKDERLSLCSVIETRLKSKKLQSIGDSIFKNWEWVNNMLHCDKGCRIIIGWNSDLINHNVIHYCKQSMLCKIDAVKRNLSLFYTVVYAANEGKERMDMWNELIMYKRVIGSDMYDFKECVDLIEVEDITSIGMFYTWTKNLYKTKNGKDAGILKKLDRAIGNEAFISKYSQAYAIFLPYLISDHCPVVLALPSTLQFKKKSFRFANFVTGKEEFRSIVKEQWGSVQEGDKLKDIQIKIDKDPTDKGLREEESKTLHDYSNALDDEEKLLYQKAKIKWLSLGDRNNSYFHRALKSRKSSLVRKIDDMEELIKTRLDENEALSMIHDVSDAEIKKAMFQIEDNKAPRPYGFSSHFYKRTWDLIGEDVCKAVQEFFHKGKILFEINSTIIALVPKIQTPAKVSDYIPIACCNVIFKCISKILTERMKKCLKKLVSQNQSAFIPTRQIQYNILISQELLKGYETKGDPKRISLKIDLQKAYDTVNWCFLEDILRGFSFHDKMVKWIMLCVTTTTFSININGESCGYFKRGRGLRQRDPMSPYLFTLVMEILNLLMIRNIEKSSAFKFHFGCDKLRITHVCFADDLLMFCHGDVDSVKVIKETIEEFGSLSGLLPNYNKSTIIFGSMNQEERLTILNMVPFKVEKPHVKYLGVPLKNKVLSYAGRLQLVASVLESIHVYWATVFLLPQIVIHEINSLLKGFLWNHEERDNGRAKVAWNSLCKPKSQGGLGLKDLGIWNRALIIKYLWHVANTYKLKGKSFLEVCKDVNDSWGWRNILKLRNELRQHLFKKVGNGETTSIWFDQWTGIGALTKFPLIYQLPAIVLNQDNIDVLIWKSNDGTLSKFFVRQAYYDLHNTSEVVPWSKLVWFSQNIPKYAFILWLAIKGTLTTQDKVKRWGSFDMMAYPLCYEDMDSHEHLKEITESSGMRKEALTTLCCKNMGQSSFLYVIRKAACLGGVPTSDALTAGLEMHS